VKLADILEAEYKDEHGRPSAAKRGYGHGWRKKRKEVIERDKGKCAKCGKAVRGKGNQQVDHKTNRNNKSGHDGKSNLQLLCGDCHRKKTGTVHRNRDKRRAYK
jgi:5-methylcytosine-specific restriction endonuclease McrA